MLAAVAVVRPPMSGTSRPSARPVQGGEREEGPARGEAVERRRRRRRNVTRVEPGEGNRFRRLGADLSARIKTNRSDNMAPRQLGKKMFRWPGRISWVIKK
ncbi:hypothetical protein GWI33_019523 [Rhynchophorus ferrugineus]|uniref:Uncharacterized protein n=1 Tax=Rhynchophorus ferrugineus TaxID=354439 RepID=A0A834M462_RHYFE|nr:hypothetical protein GWI33_019523 [Rhynchophorus ferrugineus]